MSLTDSCPDLMIHWIVQRHEPSKVHLKEEFDARIVAVEAGINNNSAAR